MAVKTLSCLVDTLAPVGFFHRLAHVGITFGRKVRLEIPELMDVASVDERGVSKYILERFAYSLAAVHHTQNPKIRPAV